MKNGDHFRLFVNNIAYFTYVGIPTMFFAGGRRPQELPIFGNH